MVSVEDNGLEAEDVLFGTSVLVGKFEKVPNFVAGQVSSCFNVQVTHA